MLAALKKKTSSLTISSVLTSESSNKYNSKSGKRDNESAICFAFLMQPTGKYCSICHTEYPEFQSGILGPYFYVLFECYYYYFFINIFIFFYLWNFFPVTRFLVTPLLVTRYSVTLFSNTRRRRRQYISWSRLNFLSCDSLLLTVSKIEFDESILLGSSRTHVGAKQIYVLRFLYTN